MKTKTLIAGIALLLTGLNSGMAQNEASYARFPSLSPDGRQLVFSFDGDLWISNSEGSDARRLSIHEAYEGRTEWSPDGKKIAFNSNRSGHNDVYVMNPQGGNIERITYRFTGNELNDWKDAQTLLFSTAREFVHVEREREIHSISANGGTSTRILDALGDFAQVSPSGRYIAYVSGSCRDERAAYRGPAQKDIFIFDTQKNTYTQLTTDEGNDINPRWISDSELLYLSGAKGVYNLHKIKISETGKAEGNTQAITEYKENGIRFFSANADGSIVAAERMDGIWTGAPSSLKKLKIALPEDYHFDPIEHKTMSSGAQEIALSPNGKYIAFSIRGEIFVKENNKEKSRAVCVTKHSHNDTDVAWVNDSTLVFSSDRNGQYDLFLLKSSDPKESDIYKSLKHESIRLTETKEDERNPIVAPSQEKLVYTKNAGNLVLASISEKSIKTDKVLLEGWAPANGVKWSPDSRWIAYNQEDLTFNDEVFILPIDGSRKPTNVSFHPRGDFSPFWSSDGTKLGFHSSRNNSNVDIWFVFLKKEDWLKTKEDWEEEPSEDKKGKSDKKEGEAKEDGKSSKKKEVDPITIDFENIHERLVQVSSLLGDESMGFFSKDGQTVYFMGVQPGSGPAKNALFSAKWDGSKLETLSPLTVMGGVLDADTKSLYYIGQGGSIGSFDLGSKKSEGQSYQAKMTLNYNLELMQVFDEAWRVIDQGFYDPNFHGKDWKKLGEMYRPIAAKCTNEIDFRYVFNWMLGEINASHMGMMGGSRAELQREVTGLLGIEIKGEKEGVKIVRIVPNGPASKGSSPLVAGDIILEVDGIAVHEKSNFYAPFINKSQEKVLLKVKRSNGSTEELVFRTQSSVDALLYEEWLNERRAMTDKLSNGQLGYLHIEGMNWESFERFERELAAIGAGKKGIVIDVRYNGGGWTTDYLMNVLNVKQHAYTVPRGAAANLEKENTKFKEYYPFGERLPYGVWTKASVALCNEASYSNAEIFSHAYKQLGIGKLVGIPTFGAVISTGGRSLLNGFMVRLPFRAWYVYNTGQNMELGPAEPHILIDNTQDAKAKGRDEQLQKAIETLLSELK